MNMQLDRQDAKDCRPSKMRNPHRPLTFPNVSLIGTVLESIKRRRIQESVN